MPLGRASGKSLLKSFSPPLFTSPITSLITLFCLSFTSGIYGLPVYPLAIAGDTSVLQFQPEAGCMTLVQQLIATGLSTSHGDCFEVHQGPNGCKSLRVALVTKLLAHCRNCNHQFSKIACISNESTILDHTLDPEFSLSTCTKVTPSGWSKTFYFKFIENLGTNRNAKGDSLELSFIHPHRTQNQYISIC